MAKVVTGSSGGNFASFASNSTGAAFAVPPASGAVVTNGADAYSVTVSGGTVSAVTVNGANVGTSGTFTVPPFATIAVTYTVAPSWSWSLVRDAGRFTPALNADGSRVARTGQG